MEEYIPMAKGKMIMGVPPDRDSDTDKKRGHITILIIFICALFAGGLFYLKNNSGTFKEKDQPQKPVQHVPKQIQPVKTQQVQIASSSPVETPIQSDIVNIDSIKNEQIQITEQEKTTQTVKAQEDNMKDTLISDQTVVSNTPPSSDLYKAKSPEQKLPVEVQHQPKNNDSILSETPTVEMQSNDNSFERPSDESLINRNVDAQPPITNVAEESGLNMENLADKTDTKILTKEKIPEKDFLKGTVISSAPKKEIIWNVKAGEYLWMIAKDPKIFGDPHQWKTIYEANKDQILDADLIYPGQKLIIPN